MLGDPGVGAPMVEEEFVEEILDDDETSPQTPEASAPATAPDPDQPPAAPADQPDPSRTRPTPEAPASTPPASPTPPAAPEGSKPTPEAPVWTVRGDRQDVPLTGTAVLDDGSVVVSPEAVPHLHQLIAEGIAHRGSWRQQAQQYQGRIKQLEQQVQHDPQRLRFESLTKQLLGILDQGPEKVAEWLDNFQANRAQLLSTAERDALQARYGSMEQRLEEYEEQEEASSVQPVYESYLERAVSHYAGLPQFQGADRGAIEERIRDALLDRVIYEVNPSERPTGLQEGEVLVGQGRKGQLYVFNYLPVQREFEYQARWLKPSNGTPPAPATVAAQRNTATLTPGAKPPAVAPASGSPPPPSGGDMKVPTFPKTAEGRRQMETWLQSGQWKKDLFPG